MSVLRLRDVTVVRGNTAILDGIDLDLTAGARHIITGHNGAGKTTLLDVIGGQAAATRGRVWLDGVDITAWPAHRRARAGVTRTWQHPMLCAPLTVAEHLTLARPASGRQLNELLDRFNLVASRHQPVAALPYGSQRCLELILAVAAMPRLLLLDEPSAGLSPTETTAIIDLLSTLDTCTTVLLTDHHPQVIAATSTSTTRMSRGRITIAEPPPTAPLADTPQRHNATSRPSSGLPRPAGLRVESLSARYSPVEVLHELSYEVSPGQITAIIGGNGAGKTTLLNAIAGIGTAHTTGAISLGAHTLTGLPPARRRQLGLSLLPQDRRVFARLTVAENLQLPPGGTDVTRDPTGLLFPQLQGRQRQKAGTLSGGEQQMLAFARAVIPRPTVLLLDEPFEGLAQQAAKRMRQAITALAETGTAIVIADHRLDGIETVADQVRHLVDGTLAPA